MEQVQNYFKITKAKFETLEKQIDMNSSGVADFKTKLIKINDDLLLVKSVADKVRNKRS